MRRRKFSYIVGILVVIFVTAGIGFWHFFQIEQKLQRTVQNKIEESFGDRLKIGRVNLAFGRVHVSDVQYTFQKAPLALHISDISLAYNLSSLWESRLQWERTSNELIIRQPRLTYILRQKQGAADSTSKPLSEEDLEKQYNEIIKYVNVIKQATIADGAVFLVDSIGLNTGKKVGKSYKVASGVNGWIGTQQNGKVNAMLAGQIFDSNDYAARINGSANLLSGTLDSLEVELNEYELKGQVFELFPSYISDIRGTLDGRVKIFENDADGNFATTGDLKISKGQFTLENANMEASDIEVETKLTNFDLQIEAGQFQLNGSPILFQGTINNLFSPSSKLDFYSPEFDIGTFASRVSQRTAFPGSGVGQLHLSLRNDFINPRLFGTFASDQLYIAGKPVQNMLVEMAFVDSTLYLKKIGAAFLDSNLDAWGKVSFKEEHMPIDVHLIADGQFLNSLAPVIPINLPENNGAIDARITGPFHSPRIHGNYALSMDNEISGSIDLLGQFSMQEWSILFGANAVDHQFNMQGRIQNLHQEPIYDLEVNGLDQLLKPFDIAPFSYITQKYSIDTRFNGIKDSLKLTMQARSVKENEVDLTTSFSLVKDRETAMKRITGNLRFNPHTDHSFTTDFEAEITDSLVHFTQVGNAEWLDGTCDIALTGDKQIDAELRFAGIELHNIVQKNDDGIPKYNGRLLGQMQISGSLDKPNVFTEAWLLDGEMNGIGRYNTDLRMSFSNNQLELEKFSIVRDDTVLVHSNGTINFSPFAMDLDLVGQGIDANQLILAVTGKDSILGGRSDFDLNLKGARWPVPATGQLRIQNGNILWFKFDELVFDFGDSLKNSTGTISQSGITSSDISYTKKEQFVLGGKAFIPFNTSDSLDVRLSGYGNILATLTDFVPVINSIESSCGLNLGLAGTYKNLRLDNSKLDVADGVITFKEVVRRLHNINGRIVTRDNFIHIEHLQGAVEKAVLRIKNTELAPVKAGHIGMPLVINGNWMSLGTLHINSSPNGVPLNIPGLMADNEIGRFAFSGMNGEESLWVGGPWYHPTFRGQVLLEDVNVIYPYAEVKGEPTPLVDYILLNSDWDILAIAGKDNRYTAEFSNIGFDKVIFNAGIDDAVSRLHFTGIILDTTTVTDPDYGVSLNPNLTDTSQLYTNGFDTSRQDRSVTLPFNFQSERLRTEAGPDTSSFRIEGQIESTRGTIEYLDLNFRVDKFAAIWDKSSLDPIVHGQAWTTVIENSYNQVANSGVNNTSATIDQAQSQTQAQQYVYLKLYAKDKETGEFKERGRFEDAYFKLESEVPIYNTSQIQVLSLIGYAPEDVKDRAANIIGASTENLFLRPLLRPVERKLERSLGLDIVRFNSRFTQNFLQSNASPYTDFKSALLQNTQLTVGKYISNKMYFLYTGQFSPTTTDLNLQLPMKFGVQHSLGLEYRFNPGLLLQLGIDYNESFYNLKQDKNIFLRYSFPLK